RPASARRTTPPSRAPQERYNFSPAGLKLLPNRFPTFFLTVFFLLFACAQVYFSPWGWSAQRLYGEAKDAMASKDWTKAIKYLEKLEARFPYGRYAQQAQLEVAYV